MVAAYSRVYDTPEDLELFSAGISENPVPGALIGPTFSCVIGRQFHNLRKGDRFFYENGGWPSSFTRSESSPCQDCYVTTPILLIPFKFMLLYFPITKLTQESHVILE